MYNLPPNYETIDLTKEPDYVLTKINYFKQLASAEWFQIFSSSGSTISECIRDNHYTHFARPAKKKNDLNEEILNKAFAEAIKYNPKIAAENKDNQILQEKLKELIANIGHHLEFLDNCYDRPLVESDWFIYKRNKDWQFFDQPNSFAKQTPRYLMKLHGFTDFAVAVRETPKPRFKCDKPYPFGY